MIKSNLTVYIPCKTSIYPMVRPTFAFFSLVVPLVGTGDERAVDSRCRVLRVGKSGPKLVGFQTFRTSVSNPDRNHRVPDVCP